MSGTNPADHAESDAWIKSRMTSAAISARARGDFAAERFALDQLALVERTEVGPVPAVSAVTEDEPSETDWVRACQALAHLVREEYGGRLDTVVATYSRASKAHIESVRKVQGYLIDGDHRA